jgi:hypothetical protein
MSNTCATDVGTAGTRTAPRVRHLAREAIGLMAFSAITSTTLAGCLLLLSALGQQG